MRNVLIFFTFLISLAAAPVAMAGTNSAVLATSTENNGSGEEKVQKKNEGPKYSFTLFNFFNYSSSTRSDTTSAEENGCGKIYGQDRPLAFLMFS